MSIKRNILACEEGRTRKDYLGFFLLAILLLNLSGLLTTLTQAPGGTTSSSFGSSVFFILSTPVAIYLITRYARSSALSTPFSFFLLFFITYLVESTLYALLNYKFDPWDLETVVVHSSQLIQTCAIYFWLAQLNEDEFADVLRFSRCVLILGTLSIVFSSSLPMYQGGQLERAGGFYIDQNSAAAVSLYCLVLIAAVPSISRVGSLMQAGIAVYALLLTFSRTGLVTLFILSFLLFVSRPSLKTALQALSAMLSASLVIWILIDWEVFHLSFEQTQRLIDVGNLLTGDTTQKTFDDRDLLFDMGLQGIAATFPWGAGIGEFHGLEYGVRHRISGSWLGVHNTYLMILGEAGLISFSVFVAFWLATLFGLTKPSPFRRFGVGVTVVILLSMFTTHSVLNDKAPAAIMGLLLAAVSPRRTAPKARRIRADVPEIVRA